ncbi:MAG TPA: hypothetical protein VFP37_07065, partial [Steroidobacteraceae bacterium]|nr:hypothetical protein [Steroidobacteraceae bacterium]
VPTRRLRSRPFVAVPVALVCLLALLTTAAFVHAKWFVEIDFEGPENVPFIVTLLLYSIALPIAEWLLVGVRPRSVPDC